MSRSYSQRTIKILAMRSGGICAYPDCSQELIIPATHDNDPDAIIGDIAHIFSYSDGGPRPNPSLTKESRNDHDNLIFLCKNHHDMVDKQENAYSVDVLLDWKRTHESEVREKVAQKVPEITSMELDIVARALLSNPSTPSTDFTILPVVKKMEKNGLTVKLGLLIRQGLAAAGDVENYVTHMAMIDSSFPEGLKAGFLKKYSELRNSGVQGDELFESLMLATNNGKYDVGYQAACLSILVYLFHKCEIFEK